MDSEADALRHDLDRCMAREHTHVAEIERWRELASWAVHLLEAHSVARHPDDTVEIERCVAAINAELAR